MKIRFVRSGGFAGLRLTLDLDTAELPASDAARLTELVEVARGTLTNAPHSRRGADQFEYELTIELHQWGHETLVLRDQDVPEPVRPLIDQLTALAR